MSELCEVRRRNTISFAQSFARPPAAQTIDPKNDSNLRPQAAPRSSLECGRKVSIVANICLYCNWRELRARPWNVRRRAILKVSPAIALKTVRFSDCRLRNRNRALISHNFFCGSFDGYLYGGLQNAIFSRLITVFWPVGGCKAWRLCRRIGRVIDRNGPKCGPVVV